MAPNNQLCFLLLSITLFWAGCASQKTQTVDHPPTSILMPGSTEGQSDLLAVELHAAAVAKEAETNPVSSGEAFKITGPAGTAGQPGATKESAAQSSLPFFPAGTEKSMQIPDFPENTLGPDSPPGLVGESPVVSLERLALPPENLAEAEYPGLAGEAGESLDPLAPSSIPLIKPEDPAEVDFPYGKPLSSFRANDQRHGTPPPSSRQPFPEIPNASAAEEEKTGKEPRIAWPWRGPEDTLKSIEVATDSKSLEDLLAWVNGRNLAKPDNKDGDLDDFSNPGEALAWLLGRAAPGGVSGSLSDARKQAAILDWLSLLRKNTSTSPYATETDRDLAGVLDWFRSGGAGADNKPPNQADLTGATRQLAHWLGQASGQDNGAGGPRDSFNSGSNAMIKWLAQGSETVVSPDSSLIRRHDLPFSFRPVPESSIATEIVRKNIAADGTFPFPSLSANNHFPPTNRPDPPRGKLHQWLQHPRTERVEEQVATHGLNGLQDSVKYSAAVSWLLRGADFSKENRSSTLSAKRAPSDLRRPDLATQEHVTEALRWFHKGSGQRRHRLHAATEAEGDTSSQTP
jgi:hypothetical protein